MFPSTFVAQIMGQTRSEKPEQSHVHFHHQQMMEQKFVNEDLNRHALFSIILKPL